MQDLLNNLEVGLKQVIDAGALGIDVFVGQDDGEQTRPNVTIYAQQGEERPVGSGNFLTTVMVSVRSNANDTTQAQHRQRCNQVFDLVMVDDLETSLSSVSNLHVFTPIVNRQASHGREDDCWLSELRFDAYCCLTDLA